MRFGKIALGGAALLMASAAASASGGRAVEAADQAGDVIAGRQAAFRMSAALFTGMKGAIDRGDDVKTQAFAARSLAGWAKAIPGMFPAGSSSAMSEALPGIWSDRPGFEARAADYATAAAKLAELAKAGDQSGFAAQWTEVGKACKACHDSYRKAEERRPG